MPASSTSNPRALSTRQVHLWYTYPTRATDHDLLCGYREMLSEHEAERYNRFVFEKDRHAFLVAHVLLRTTLSRYAKASPATWRFSENDYGKPDISAPPECSQLRFNISHTDGLVVCAVTRDHEVGVDVENVERPAPVEDLARRNFADNEITDLQRLPQEQRPDRFFDYWTLKEAYIKARGLGLSIPLDGFWFQLVDDDRASIHFLSTLPEDASLWQFMRFRPTSRHRIAIAVRRPAGTNLEIVVRQTVPLIDQT